jgi:sRNA-binding regulator protein Hfq
MSVENKIIETYSYRRITVFLKNGVKLEGEIVKETVRKDHFELERDGITQLVMMDAVATIMPKIDENHLPSWANLKR